MRKISKFEENLISQMTDKEWNGNLNLPNLLDKYLKNVRIKILRDQQQVEILFEIQNKTPTEAETKLILSRVNEINELIISTVNLINLLEKEGYIILFESASQIDNELVFGQGAVNLPSVRYTFPDNRTAELLVKYASPQIIITSELLEYRKVNFQTREEIRHFQNIRLAWIGISISIIATVFSLGFNLFDSLIKKDNSECICPSLLEIKTELKATNEFILKTQKEKENVDSLKPQTFKALPVKKP